MHPIDWAIVVCYFAVVIGVGFWSENPDLSTKGEFRLPFAHG